MNTHSLLKPALMAVGLTTALACASCEERDGGNANDLTTTEDRPLGYVPPQRDRDEAAAPEGDVGPLTIERSGEAEASQGEFYHYTITVTNTSETPVSNVIVTEVTAGGLEIDRSDPMFHHPHGQERQQMQSDPKPQYRGTGQANRSGESMNALQSRQDQDQSSTARSNAQSNQRADQSGQSRSTTQSASETGNQQQIQSMLQQALTQAGLSQDQARPRAMQLSQRFSQQNMNRQQMQQELQSAFTQAGMQREQAQQRAQQLAERINQMMSGQAGGQENRRDQRDATEDSRAGQATGAQQNQGRSPSNQSRSRQAQAGEMRPDVFRWNLGLLNAGESRTIDVYAIPMQPGMVQSCLSVSYEPVVCAQLTVVAPELRLTARAPQAVYACDEIPIEVRVSNVGTGSTEEGRIFIELPQGLTTEDGEQQAAMEFEELSAGDTAEQTLVLRATDPGEYSFRVTAESAAGQVQSSRVRVFAYQPQLNLQVNGPRQAYLGSRATYEIIVSNPSNVAVVNAVVQIEEPENASRFAMGAGELDVDDNQVRIERLDPGESRSVYVAFEGNQAGPVQARVAAAAHCVRAVQQSLTAEFVGIPAVRLEVFDRADPVPVGEPTLYEVRVTNQGSAEDLNIQLQARMPQGMQFLGAEGDSRIQAQGQQLDFGPIDRLGPGEVAVWMIRASSNQAGSTRFEVQLTSDANTQPVQDVEPTTIFDGAQPEQTPGTRQNQNQGQHQGQNQGQNQGQDRGGNQDRNPDQQNSQQP